MACAAAALRVAHQVDAAVVDGELLSHHRQHVHHVLFAVSVTVAGSVSFAPPTSGGCGRAAPVAGRRERRAVGRPPGAVRDVVRIHAEAGAVVVADRPDQDVAALLGEVHCRAAHECQRRTSESAQGDDERRLLAVLHFRGYED